MTSARDVETGIEIVATAFRDDQTAALVTIADFSFEGCKIMSEATFSVGERLRLHIRKQGWIEAYVASAQGEQASVVFNTHCRV